MVANIKFSKFDDTPWGFRLVGGTDFEFPLTVIKVNEDSLAEKAGLVEGDIIVRINETPTINLTHLDAHALLKRSGNNFMLGVLRDGETINDESVQRELSRTPECLSLSEKYERSSVSDSVSVHSVQSHKSEVRVHKEMYMHEGHITDEAIAELMSGEAEVLKDHKVLGVNFKKIIPQSGILKNSEVFNTLNSEAVKSKEEIEMEQKKWSTFLQRPNRPIPKKKSDIEAQQQIQADGYKVRIVKQPKPRVAPGRTPTPEPMPVPIVISTADDSDPPSYESVSPEVSVTQTVHIPLKDSEVPDLTSTESTSESRSMSRMSRSETSMSNRTEEFSKEESISVSSEVAIQSESSTQSSIKVEKTEQEIFLEKQLADLQQQLSALSNLPLTIQAALDDVTKKISSLVPVISQVKEGKHKKVVQAEQVEIQEEMAEEVTNVESSETEIEISSETAESNVVCEVSTSCETEESTETEVHETEMCIKRGNEIEIKKKMNVIEIIEEEDDPKKIKPDPDWQTKPSRKKKRLGPWAISTLRFDVDVKVT